MAFRVVKFLRHLLDVDTTGVADGDALTYDAGSGKWVPAASSGGGGGFAIGSSYLIAAGDAQAGIAAGDQSTNVQWTQDTLVGSDLEIDGLDAGLINVLTAGFYQVTAKHGMNGSAPTSFQVTIYANPSYDSYVGVDPDVGGADLVVSTPVLSIASGGVIRVRAYADGTGTWNLEGNPSEITVMRMA